MIAKSNRIEVTARINVKALGLNIKVASHKESVSFWIECWPTSKAANSAQHNIPAAAGHIDVEG